jgi:uncharacterized protein
LYKTATGNYLVLDGVQSELLNRVAREWVAPAQGGLLYRAGFVLEDEIDEVEAVGQAFSLSRSSRYAPSLTIAPTMDCNFGCAYCFENHVPGAMREPVQDHLVDFALSHCRSVGERTPLAVTWFGGEPLMGLKAIDRLTGRFQALRERGEIGEYRASIITNGYGLTPQTCAVLDRCEIVHVQITVDGPARIHDQRRFLKRNGGPTFARILENIGNLPPAMAVLVRMNVDRENMGAFEELFEALEQLDLLERVVVDLAQVENFSAAATAPSVLNSRDFAAFKSEAIALCERRSWPIVAEAPSVSLTGVCQVDSLNSFVISAKGELYKCWAELENDGHVVGRLDQPDTWHAVVQTPLTGRDPLDDTECRECRLLPTCMGSCPMVRDLNRRFHGKQCPPYKYHFEALVSRQFGETTNIRRYLHAE